MPSVGDSPVVLFPLKEKEKRKKEKNPSKPLLTGIYFPPFPPLL
jgi:hypothetical protein